jgi:hypothetical protein
VKDHATGKTLLTAPIPLTPGPLLVVVKDAWPPTESTNVETIAASFVPPTNGSKVRLFNLASDVPEAGLLGADGRAITSGPVKYTLGSNWVPVPSSQQHFSAVADTAAAAHPYGQGGERDGGGALATATFTPPAAPEVFTVFLMGSKSFGYSLLPQVDAPETGPCKPP